MGIIDKNDVFRVDSLRNDWAEAILSITTRAVLPRDYLSYGGTRMELRLGFIGAGNMSGAILGGILDSGLLPPERVFLSNRHEDKLAGFRRRGVNTTTDNIRVVREADVVVLGVKPQMFDTVLPEIAPFAAGKCVVSISPGFSTAYLRTALPGCYVMRAMPNTPLLVGKGVTAVVEAPEVPAPLFQAVLDVFSSAGRVELVPEELMDAVISVSGSSPAYFFRMADAMVQGARSFGMAPEQALRMAALTMEGAARMLLESGKDAGELTRQVCSPGGTTLAALSAFDDYRFEELLAEAMARCAKRSAELGK